MGFCLDFESSNMLGKQLWKTLVNNIDGENLDILFVFFRPLS